MGKQNFSEKPKLLAREARTGTLRSAEPAVKPSAAPLSKGRSRPEAKQGTRLARQVTTQVTTQGLGRTGGRQLAVQTIAFYQRYLSPLKGFHCAHRRLHGGLSCSEYVKQTIAAQGIKRSLPLCRERFRACRSAHEILKVQQALKARTLLLGQSLESDPPEDGDEQEPSAETITQGEYYAAPDLNPVLPPPNPLASCLLCGVIDGCCGGPSSLGGMGCGDPLEGCSCCWDGFDLSACSCCL